MAEGKETVMLNPTPEQLARGVVGVLDGVEIFDPSHGVDFSGEVFRHGRRSRRHDRSALKVGLSRYASRLPHKTK